MAGKKRSSSKKKPAGPAKMAYRAPLSLSVAERASRLLDQVSEERARRDFANRRAKVATRAPTLAEALQPYTKDVLVEIAHKTDVWESAR